MAVSSLRDLVGSFVNRELNPARRYRCLVLQTDRLDLLGRLCEFVPSSLSGTPQVLGWERFFDEVGAVSADNARDCIVSAGRNEIVILSGPLHYIDYWTLGVQEGFWSFLSLYSRGPGIIAVDIPRTDGVEGPFVARGLIPGTDIRFLRPRLVATEESFL